MESERRIRCLVCNSLVDYRHLDEMGTYLGEEGFICDSCDNKDSWREEEEPPTPLRIPVILHYADYRGDHAADVRRTVLLPADTPLSELLEIIEDRSRNLKQAASIEVTLVDGLEPRPEKAKDSKLRL